MKITAISDLHGHKPSLSGGDLLIIAGDLTATDKWVDWLFFFNDISCWSKIYKNIVVIGGNHDNELVKSDILKSFYAHISDINFDKPKITNVHYLKDESITIDGLKIWGSPWSPSFVGVNPRCKAFMRNDSLLKNKYAKIPNDIDILISHTPPYGLCDRIEEFGTHYHAGSKTLLNLLDSGRLKNLKYLFCGHIHEQGGTQTEYKGVKIVNCSYLNERYKPIPNILQTATHDLQD